MNLVLRLQTDLVELFPYLSDLNTPTLSALVLTWVAFFSALAPIFRWYWCCLFLLISLCAPTLWIWLFPPQGQYAGLGSTLIIFACISTLVFGVAVGSFLRCTSLETWQSVLGIVVSGVLLAGATLWEQHVPSACIGAKLQVKIAEKALSIPSEMHPLVETEHSKLVFGRLDRKASFAKSCRLSENGAKLIDANSVWLTPASNHKAMTRACAPDSSSAWCSIYSPETYSLIGKIRISSNTVPDFPSSYWKEGGSLAKIRSGNLKQGSLCLLPGADIRTQCWLWQPYGQGGKLTISTNNLDHAFDGMETEDALKILRQARSIALAILEN